ncbi:MAG TPA: phosphotransferase [Acidocella sp.]|nr:phosphotransferase [Acidocella sp.]
MSSAPRLIEPLPAHQLDTVKLFAYLKDHVEGFATPASLQQFQGGQSNPTYLIATPTQKYVLRKKPPGHLLPSAHMIDREYRIQKALAGAGVPVVKMYHYATDISVIGTEFYVMEYLEGRVFSDVLMEDLTAAQLFATIGALHAADYTALGLADYGKPSQYIARQIDRWTKQYIASCTEDLPAMNNLIAYLTAHIPADDTTSIVHGDFRLGNMMIHPTEPRIIAVLDWELSTLGHPLADLAYCCMPYHMPEKAGPAYSGYAGVDLAAHGLKSEAEVLDIYCAQTKRAGIENWNFYLGFALFRSAAIAEGVYARSLAGNAADERGSKFHAMTKLTSETGWEIVNR